MVKNIIAILLLGILLVTGCTQVPSDNNNLNEKEISFDTIDKDFNSNLEEQNQYVIQSTEEFQEFWDKVGSLKLLNDIDFSKYTVIAVAQGQKTSGGYSIEITKIIEKEDSILVSIKETVAGPGQAAAVITSPYHIVRIPKTTKLIKFESKTQDSEKNWINELIDKELKGQVNPLDRDYGYLSKCQYKSETHYLLVRPCCDQFNELFDESGNSICLPSGGETGKGDGKCPDFNKEIKNCEVIWKPSISNENPKNIELNKEFILEIGEQAVLKENDLKIKFLEVVEDSRCPIDVQCIKAGSLRIKIDARYDNEKNLGQYELELGDNNAIDSSISIIPEKYRDELSSPIAHRIEFVKAETGSAETLDLNVFTATFKVTEAFTQ